ncbi:hypothetical protein QAD02_007974 [Eretmocerus hayati]|uniref:Uncharacterized protein n=1 Tax=Eretmocerus hayati TaxID=131215 RepID=A0ACC2N7K8_9HYME|nr:hypothetical protein QAD02_007974 [Eretmocerus hayati]
MPGQCKDHAYSHAENRSKLCVFCLKVKSGMRVMGKCLREKISQLTVYDAEDDRIPNSICECCKIKLYQAFKFGKEKPILPDYSHFPFPSKNTRLKADKLCECTSCLLARKKGFEKKTALYESSVVMKVCTKCRSEVAKGKEHRCNTSTKRKNLTNVAKTLMSPKSKKHFVCDVVREKLAENQSDEKIGGSTIALSQMHGKKLKLIKPTRGPSARSTAKSLSAEQMSRIQTSHNLSSKTMQGILSSLRIATGNRKLFESNLREKLSSLNHRLEFHFETRKVTFIHKNGNITKSVEREFVICKNLQALIDYIKEYRRCGQVHIKIAIDGGGGFLKICLTILSDQIVDATYSELGSRQKYDDGVAAKKFREGGVEKLFIIGLVAGVQENYENASCLIQARAFVVGAQLLKRICTGVGIIGRLVAASRIMKIG